MLIHYDPDAHVTEVERRTCLFHQRNPGGSYAGCTCSMSVGERKATPEEYRTARLHRLRKEVDEYRAIVGGIEREIERLEAGEVPLP